jgi:hypothetical protein
MKNSGRRSNRDRGVKRGLGGMAMKIPFQSSPGRLGERVENLKKGFALVPHAAMK